MRRIRVIPVLLVHNNGLVKTVRFDAQTYVGDPINAVKIFNEKEVDEIVILDISATQIDGPNFKLIEQLATECFMPFCYGGGITHIDQVQKILSIGAEKVSINSAFKNGFDLAKKASQRFGSQAVVVSIDVKKRWWGTYEVFTHGGKKGTGRNPVDYALDAQSAGAGEVLLNAMDRDGTFEGYDTDLIHQVAQAVDIPLVALGGARDVNDFAKAVTAGASAVAAGSMFVFHGIHRAVLINFPSQEVLKEKLYSH